MANPSIQPTSPQADVGSEKRGVQSVEIAYRILRTIQDAEGPIALGDIARRASLSASAAHNYLVSLQRTGLISSPGRGIYRLGSSAFSLGLVALRQLDEFDVVRAGAEALGNRIDATVTLCVWSEQGPVVVFKQDARAYAALDIRPGLKLSTLGSAAGRAFVACLDPAVTASVISRHDSRDPADQEEEIRRARSSFARLGYASKNLFGGVGGYRAFAAPIWANAGDLRYVLVAMAPRTEFVGSRNEMFASALLASAAEISAVLGHRVGLKSPRADATK
jgi:DNA-binding IclR family transcriptional regulator